MILVKLGKTAGSRDGFPHQQQPPTRVALHYTSVLGERHVQYHEVLLPLHSDKSESQEPQLDLEQFDSTAVRKGVLLHRYVEFVRELLDWRWGCLPAGFRKELNAFGDRFRQEATQIGDPKLLNEVKMWDKLNAISEKKQGTETTCCEIM